MTREGAQGGGGGILKLGASAVQALSPERRGSRLSDSPMGFGAHRHWHDSLLMCASILNKRHPLGVNDLADILDCPYPAYHGGRRPSAVKSLILHCTASVNAGLRGEEAGRTL